MPDTAPLLEIRGITKSFFGVKVLSAVDLTCGRGEIHAVVGENGAGKSTLMKILAGAYQADSGKVLLEGQEVHFRHPDEAQRRGVSIIYQEFNLLPDRTVAQNIFLGREPKRGPIVDAGAMAERTNKLLEALHMEDSISPGMMVRDLSVAQQQMVEIAKALSFDARLLVLDEPTAALAPREAESLFERVRLLKSRGLGLLYVSHRLKEVFELADRITVLKDGVRVDTLVTNTVTPPALVRMMVGRELLSNYFPERARQADLGEVKVRLRGGGGGTVHDVDLEVRAGEIVGIAGLEGSGTTELARLLFGADRLQKGTLELEGKTGRIRSPRQAILHGMGFLSEDRKAEGLILPQSIRDNTLLSLRSLGWRLRRRLSGKNGHVESLAKQVDLRATDLEREVQYLSGGNQQKVVLAKWLATRSRVYVFDEPTRGIDVGAKAGIHELMRELARQGAAIVMVSSELPEVIGMSDRVVVMRGGTVAGELQAGASESEIMFLATGEAEVNKAS